MAVPFRAAGPSLGLGPVLEMSEQFLPEGSNIQSAPKSAAQAKNELNGKACDARWCVISKVRFHTLTC